MTIALVTGASRGLGKDMALAIADSGTDVVITYLGNQEMAEEVVAEIKTKGRKAAALRLDVSDSASFPAFFDALMEALKATFGATKIDYLVNNAGVGIRAGFADTSEEQFDQMVNIHLKSAFFLTQQALPILADGGGVVNVSSGLTRFTFSGTDAYAVVKGAVEVLTRYQAKALGERGIRVNCLAPGAIETDFGGGSVRDNPDVNKFVASQTALGRAGRPDDIGSIVAFLCSDASKWINGQRIEASGGMCL